jgi:hypothetical protein
MQSNRMLTTLGAIAVTLLVGTATVACSNSGGPTGRTITVPVLWAGTSTDGEVQSGIEPAEITVGDGGAQFTLNLDDLQAKKTGAQWNAATASAAAVATLASALDPAKVDVSYRVTGPIDGPSGGAMLTVGTLAGLRGDTLRRDTTMTGTISPDGSVGRVGGIPAKIRAASEAGYTKVLLPTANLRASGEPSTTDMVAYGTSLGLEIRGVDTVAEAYEAFTGVQLIPPGTSAPGLSPPVQAAAEATTRGLVDRLRTRLAAAPSTLSGERSIAQRGLASAEAALAAGDLARAYGVAVDAYTVLARAEGAAEVDGVIATSGIEGARRALRTDVAALRARATEVLRSGSRMTGVDAVTQILTPAALGWTTYSDAVLAGIDGGLADGSITAAGMTVTGAVIAEQEASIDVFQADALTMVRSAPNAQVTTVHPPSEFLSGYTDFLVRAGRANAEYYTAVVSRGRAATTDVNGQPAFTVLALGALTAAAESIPSGIQTIDEEIRQSALAFTFFVIGTGLVANTSSTGISGSAIGSDAVSTIDVPGIVRSVEEASALVDTYAAAFVARSIDTGSPLWSSRWGVGAALALNGTGRDATGEVIAQNELWYDVVAMSSLWAATTP